MNGSQVLESLNRHADAIAAVIIRHADRLTISSVTDSLRVGLNQKGREDALRFGRGIAGDRPVRFFHSPALRCRETAEAIAQGLTMSGRSVLGQSETWDLCAPYLKDDRTLAVADRLGHGFMRAWFDGQIDPEWLLPAPQAASTVLSPILGQMAVPEEGPRLDVHVSHDWEVVLLRDVLFRTRYEYEGWIGYLDGIMFVREADAVTAWWGNASVSIPLPDGH